MPNKHLTIPIVFTLLLVNLFYASVSLATKFTSQQKPLTIYFLCGISVVVLMLGVYAILWQQVLKRIELTTAYMFKGTSLIFVILFSALLFNETITWQNAVGALLIVGGIVSFAKS
jgi:drug/metabolite transporter (DMT)-like permease